MDEDTNNDDLNPRWEYAEEIVKERRRRNGEDWLNDNDETDDDDE